MNDNALTQKADLIWSVLNSIDNANKTKQEQLDLIKPLLLEIANQERLIGRSQILNHLKKEIHNLF